MKEGERALLHVPSAMGYRGTPMGSQGGAFYISENSDLLCDIEILGKNKQGFVKAIMSEFLDIVFDVKRL